MYEVYITEALRVISQNIARGYEDAPYMAEKFLDVLEPKADSKETAENVKDRIKAKLQEYEDNG